MYRVVISKLAGKEIKALPKPEIAKIISKIEALAEDPRPDGCKKLVGTKEDVWRIRSGDYRIVYTIDDVIRIVDVKRVGHRRDVYK